MIAKEPNIDRDPLALRLVRMAAEFENLIGSDPEGASRLADAAATVIAVWPLKARTIGCLPARGGERLESGETDEILAMFVEDEEMARWLAGAPTH